MSFLFTFIRAVRNIAFHSGCKSEGKNRYPGAKAKENLIISTEGNNPQPLANLPNPEKINTRGELARMSGVSARLNR